MQPRDGRCTTSAPLWPLALLLCSAGVHAEPDEDALGKSQGYPVGGPPTWYTTPYRVGSWSATGPASACRCAPWRAGTDVMPLPDAAAPPAIRYRWRNIGYTLDDYLERRRVTGLLILKNGEIVAERYRYARTPEARFLSFSMAKSVTSLLVGIALDKGLIASLDDPAARYVKDLEGSAYGATTVRQLLRMSSGIRFTERYDGNDDVARLSRAIAGSQRPAPAGAAAHLRRACIAPAGEKFAYATAETEVLGRVLTGATGKTMAELTSEWLWKPMGAERDAFWRVGADGQEQAGGGFNATLRDWGRLGVLLANDGQVARPRHRAARLPARRHRRRAPARRLRAARAPRPSSATATSSGCTR